MFVEPRKPRPSQALRFSFQSTLPRQPRTILFLILVLEESLGEGWIKSSYHQRAFCSSPSSSGSLEGGLAIKSPSPEPGEPQRAPANS